MHTPAATAAPRRESDRTPLRTLLLASVLGILSITACNSALENRRGGLDQPPPQSPDISNQRKLSFGFDPGMTVEISDDANDHAVAVAGGVIPGVNGDDRHVVFFAFATPTPASSQGTVGTTNTPVTLDRDGSTDTNGQSDVFVAAIVSDGVDPFTFTEGVVQTMRHPRCQTCHSMAVAPATTAFGEAGHPGGTPPLAANDAGACATCHGPFADNDWRTPPAPFDFRGKSNRALYEGAIVAPPGQSLEKHFLEDPRINWALDDGRLPTTPTPSFADDDRDGLAETADTDGTNRTVPGGFAFFRQAILKWIEGGTRFNSADSAVHDIVLVSRVGTTAANGASTQPSLSFAPNTGFDPAVGGSIGDLRIAFTSTAPDFAPNDDAASPDVFVVRAGATVAPASDTTTPLDLQIDFGTMQLVSMNTGGNPAGGSSAPALGGSNGELVAFESLAGDLVAGFTDGNGANAPDLFVRNLNNTTTQALTNGNGGSFAPTVDPAGNAFAFESDANDLVAGDANEVRDVFFRRRNPDDSLQAIELASLSASGDRASGGASRSPSVVVRGADLLVAFESDKSDLVAAVPAMSTTNAYVRVVRANAAESTTLLVNQRIENGTATLGDQDDGKAPASSFAPRLSANGNRLAFVTHADNLIDGSTTTDNGSEAFADHNGVADVLIANIGAWLDASPDTASLNHLYVSVSPNSGSADYDGQTDAATAATRRGSTMPLIGTFSGSTDARGFLLYNTDTDNVGRSDNDDNVIVFVDEIVRGKVADIEVSGPPRVGTELSFSIDSTDSDSISSIKWSFGDPSSGNANSSTERAPKHTFNAVGTYTIRLETTFSDGLEATDEVTITVRQAVDANFAAATLAGGTDVVEDLALTFADSSTGVIDPSNASYAWSIDGVQVATTRNLDRTFADPGTFVIQLRVEDTDGAVDTEQFTLTVHQRVSANFTFATPSGNPASVTNPQVNFSTTSVVGTIVSHNWDFDDGGANSALAAPQHTFSGAGSFDVTLTVTGPGVGNTSTPVMNNVLVIGALVVSISPSATQVLRPSGGTADITFTATFPATPPQDLNQVRYTWNFGTGQGGVVGVGPTFNSVTHAYTASGPFTCSVTAEDLVAVQDDTDTQNVTVFTQVVGTFSITGTGITRTMTATQAGASYEWDLDGDGVAFNSISATTQTVSNFTFEPGSNIVRLRVTGAGPSNIATSTQTPNIVATFQNVYDEVILGGACGSCHITGGQNTAILLNTQPLSFTQLTTGNAGACGDYVVDGNANASYVVQKLEQTTPCAGTQMPPPGGGAPDPWPPGSVEFAIMRSWIDSGAPNN